MPQPEENPNQALLISFIRNIVDALRNMAPAFALIWGTYQEYKKQGGDQDFDKWLSDLLASLSDTDKNQQ